MGRRGYLIDALVVAAGLAVSLSVLAFGPAGEPGTRSPDVWAFLLVAGYHGAAVVRRRFPRGSMVAGLLTALAYGGAGYPTALTPLVALAIYSVATTSPPAAAARRLLVAAVALSALTATTGPGPTRLDQPLIAAGAWLLGHAARARRQHTAELERKNAELEQAQHDLARQAVTEERLRIARELHDVVAHTMTVVAMHAGSGRLASRTDPAAAERALGTIETASRQAVRELRDLLGVLRSTDAGEPAPLAPTPGLADLPALIAAMATPATPIDLIVDGDRPDVPPGLDLSAYRIVQEALTNAVRHAGPATVTVRITYAGTEIGVTVDDDGRAKRTDPAPSSGHGLIGMRERVAVHGGSLEVGPRAGGGWRVAARLPIGSGS